MFIAKNWQGKSAFEIILFLCFSGLFSKVYMLASGETVEKEDESLAFMLLCVRKSLN
jgi:hypothetical protein